MCVSALLDYPRFQAMLYALLPYKKLLQINLHLSVVIIVYDCIFFHNLQRRRYTRKLNYNSITYLSDGFHKITERSIQSISIILSVSFLIQWLVLIIGIRLQTIEVPLYQQYLEQWLVCIFNSFSLNWYQRMDRFIPTCKWTLYCLHSNISSIKKGRQSFILGLVWWSLRLTEIHLLTYFRY